MIISSTQSLSSTNTISVLGYNILLPNSIGGWWIYKMYSPRHYLSSNAQEFDPNIMTWEYRCKLIAKEIMTADCDIVCYQEVNPLSHESDFQFMKELGYDQSVIYRKGDFCPAIFWKSTKVVPVSEPIHRDRCLIIPFQIVSIDDEQSSTSVQLPLYVCNCHLLAGNNNSERRLRQIHDSLETIRKHATKLINTHVETLKKKTTSKKKRNHRPQSNNNITESETEQVLAPPPPPAAVVVNYVELAANLLKSLPIVLLGDMNCDPVDSSGSHSLLVYGEATVNGKIERDDENENKKEGTEEKELTIKSHPFKPFIDTYDFAYRCQQDPLLSQQQQSQPPPPTMIVEELYEILTEPLLLDSSSTCENSSLSSPLASYNLQLTSLARDRLQQMFQKYARTSLGTSSELVMNHDEIKRWLVDINKEWNRGTEFHETIKRAKLFPSSLPPSQDQENRIHNDKYSDDQNEIQEEENGNTVRTIPENCYLDWNEFCSIYEQMIAEGKVWAVSSDMAACGSPLPHSSCVYTARYDRIYLSGGLQDQLLHVRDIPCGSIEEGCQGVGGCLPNALYPSDHLAVAISFKLPQLLT